MGIGLREKIESDTNPDPSTGTIFSSVVSIIYDIRKPRRVRKVVFDKIAMSIPRFDPRTKLLHVAESMCQRASVDRSWSPSTCLPMTNTWHARDEINRNFTSLYRPLVNRQAQAEFRPLVKNPEQTRIKAQASLTQQPHSHPSASPPPIKESKTYLD
jgi:hypothetical protein